ncbi:MAG: DNA-processing protein DprA [Rhodospirillales bacterium]
MTAEPPSSVDSGAAAAVLCDQERLERLRLIRSENVGPITFRRLVARYGSAVAALKALPELARRGGTGAAPRVCSVAEAEAELAALGAIGARLVAMDEPDYPPLLRHIDDAPPLIAMLGDASILRRAAIAIVGARNASLNGRRIAADLARGLGAAGCTVVSGLAHGIDAAAHDAALASGTAAVVAGGADVVYPQDHQDLYAAIAERGLILAEMPPGLRPQAGYFPRRNRLISGTCQGVVVVEASLRSGSLITARFALEQGREVMAVPGSPLDPRARGANDLIRQGATLVETPADVLNALARPTSRPSPPPLDLGPIPEADADDARGDAEADAAERLAAALSAAPVTVDELIRSCQLSPPLVTTILLEWELAGRIERLPGNRITMIAFAKSPSR